MPQNDKGKGKKQDQAEGTLHRADAVKGFEKHPPLRRANATRDLKGKEEVQPDTPTVEAPKAKTRPGKKPLPQTPGGVEDLKKMAFEAESSVLKKFMVEKDRIAKKFEAALKSPAYSAESKAIIKQRQEAFENNIKIFLDTEPNLLSLNQKMDTLQKLAIAIDAHFPTMQRPLPKVPEKPQQKAEVKPVEPAPAAKAATPPPRPTTPLPKAPLTQARLNKKIQAIQERWDNMQKEMATSPYKETLEQFKKDLGSRGRELYSMQKNMYDFNKKPQDLNAVEQMYDFYKKVIDRADKLIDKVELAMAGPLYDVEPVAPKPTVQEQVQAAMAKHQVKPGEATDWDQAPKPAAAEPTTKPSTPEIKITPPEMTGEQAKAVAKLQAKVEKMVERREEVMKEVNGSPKKDEILKQNGADIKRQEDALKLLGERIDKFKKDPGDAAFKELNHAVRKALHSMDKALDKYESQTWIMYDAEKPKSVQEQLQEVMQKHQVQPGGASDWEEKQKPAAVAPAAPATPDPAKMAPPPPPPPPDPSKRAAPPPPPPPHQANKGAAAPVPPAANPVSSSAQPKSLLDEIRAGKALKQAGPANTDDKPKEESAMEKALKGAMAGMRVREEKAEVDEPSSDWDDDKENEEKPRGPGMRR